MRVLLIGGKYDRWTGDISKTPDHISIQGQLYDRIDDPDSGDPLGAYARALP